MRHGDSTQSSSARLASGNRGDVREVGRRGLRHTRPAHGICEDPWPRHRQRHRCCLAWIVVVSIGRELEIALGYRVEPCGTRKSAMKFVQLGELGIPDVEEKVRVEELAAPPSSQTNSFIDQMVADQPKDGQPS